jgi:hypothetical protein
MKLIWACLLPLTGLLVGCGSSPSSNTLSITCGGSLSMAGAKSIEIGSDSPNTGLTLSYPDPANPGHTGSVAVKPGMHCTVAPTANV